MSQAADPIWLRSGPARARFGLAAWAVALAALTALPYVYLSARTAHYADARAQFNWIIPPYPEDSNAYAAWVEQASSGAWLLSVKSVLLGHWAQSVDSSETQRWLGWLFSQDSEADDAARGAAMRERRIRYVLVEPKMRRDWFGGPTPKWLERDYELIFRAGPVDLLQARP